MLDVLIRITEYAIWVLENSDSCVLGMESTAIADEVVRLADQVSRGYITESDAYNEIYNRIKYYEQLCRKIH